MGGMAAGAAQLPPYARRVFSSPDGVVAAKAVAAEDMPAVLLVVVAGLAEGREGLDQQCAVVGSMGIVARGAIPGRHRRMDVRLCEHVLVMALEAQFGDFFREGLFRLLLSMGRLMARWTALLHANELGDGRMDDAFGDQFLVAVQTGLLGS